MLRLFPFIVVVFLWMLLIAVVTLKKMPNGCFRAAVLDHVHQTDPAHKFDPVRNLELNFKVYEDAVAIAKKQGADIIVFPENGLIYTLMSRQQANRYASDIPDSNMNLCSTDKRNVINHLSCLAQKHQIFIAANLIDRKSCEELNLSNSSDLCPVDKKFLFNTAVLFDRKGILIGRYHKMHLFGEMTMNIPPKPELVVIHTELGRLGLQICFDMIYEKPGHLLAQENKIDTMIFPTWWFDEAPFLSSSQYQMAWAFGNNVTLLASNIHRIELGSRGSGIYVGSQRKFIYSLYDDSIERLILANVPIKPKSKTDCPLDPEIVTVPQQIPIKNPKKYQRKNLNLMGTKLMELPDNGSKVHVCHQGVCCSLEYLRFKNQLKCNLQDYIPFWSTLVTYYSSSDEHYYLLAGNRTRPSIYPWSEEFCALVYCPSTSIFTSNDKTCSHFGSNRELNTRFSYAKLTGEFSTQTSVYPSVVGFKDKLIQPENKWTYWQINQNNSKKLTKQFVIEFGSKKASEDSASQLDTLALYGRVYERDPLYERKDIKIYL